MRSLARQCARTETSLGRRLVIPCLHIGRRRLSWITRVPSLIGSWRGYTLRRAEVSTQRSPTEDTEIRWIYICRCRIYGGWKRERWNRIYLVNRETAFMSAVLFGQLSPCNEHDDEHVAGSRSTLLLVLRGLPCRYCLIMLSFGWVTCWTSFAQRSSTM